MTANVEVFENRSTAVTETVLEVLRVDTNISVFHQIVTEAVSSNEGSMKAPTEPKITELEGLIDDKNLSFLKKGREFKTLTKYVVMKPAMRECFATHHYSRAWEHPLFKTDVVRGKGLFDHFKHGGTADDLVVMDTGSHMLFDRHGEALPTGILFDYIAAGRISNRNYNLEKAAEILLARPDVDVWAHQGGYKSDRPAEIRDADTSKKTGECKLAETVEEALFTIPYYNAERGRTHTMYFLWKPSVEDYRKMWDACKATKTSYPSTNMHQCIFELDLLGLRAGGAAKHDDSYKDDRDTSSDDEED